MMGEMDRLKQDLAVMEKAVGGKAYLGPQHVGLGVGFGLGGTITLLLSLFTTWLNTLPTRLILIPLFLVLPVLTAWITSPKPFRLVSLFNTGTTRAESNTLAIIVGVTIMVFAFLLKHFGVPYPVVPSVGLAMSAVYLFPLAWGRPQNYWMMVYAVVFFIMAVVFPFIPTAYCTALFGGGLAISGFVSAAMIRNQIGKSTD